MKEEKKERSTSAYRSICRTCHLYDRKEKDVYVNDTITISNAEFGWVSVSYLSFTLTYLPSKSTNYILYNISFERHVLSAKKSLK